MPRKTSECAAFGLYLHVSKQFFLVNLDEAHAYVLLDTSPCGVFMAGLACWKPYARHYHDGQAHAV